MEIETLNMSTLVVVAYKDKFKAEEVRICLSKMQRDDLIDIEDAVVAVRDPDHSEVKLRQATHPPVGRAIRGGFWGLLIGTLFMSPLLGLVVGARGGTVGRALSEMGIEEEFIRSLASAMAPGGSALFVLVRNAKPDRVLAELKGTGGKILKTSLSHEDEATLQAALSEAKAA